jgi:CheY-like chemotaxis protein
MTGKGTRRGLGPAAILRAGAPACAAAPVSAEAAEGAGVDAAAATSAHVSSSEGGAFAADARAAGVSRPSGFEPRRAQRGSTEIAAGEPALANAAHLPKAAHPPKAHLPNAAGAGPGVASTESRVASVGSRGADGLSWSACAASPVPRALVVDDDPEVRRAPARFLRFELEVCLAASVSSARAIIASIDRLDVAFIDWDLPDGTGEEILEWLARWPDAIRVLITARFASSSGQDRSGESPLQNRALANLVLGKPVATSAMEALKRAALALPHD